MIKKTTHYELSKPDYNETADIEVINSNMDIIDGALHELKGDLTKYYVEGIKKETDVAENVLTDDIVTRGAYISNNAGDIVESEEFGYTDYIDISDCEYLEWVGGGASNSVWLYDSNMTLKYRGTLAQIVGETPEYAYLKKIKYIRFNVTLAELPNNKLLFHSIKRMIDVSQVNGLDSKLSEIPKNTVLNFSDYANLKTVVEYANSIASSKNRVEIRIPKGRHNAFDGITLESESSSFVGIVLNDYVDLVGEGSPQNTEIYAEIPSGTYNFNRNIVSTLNLWRNNNIKNIKVSSKNMRYPIHNDKAINDEPLFCKELFENCIFYADGEDGITADNIAFGSGAGYGRQTEFVNCVFESTMNPRMCTNFHNRAIQSIPVLWTFKHCKWIGGQHAMLVTNYGSGQNDTFNFVGCLTDRKFLFQSSSGSRVCDYTFRGCGNSIFDGSPFKAVFNGVDDGDFHEMMF